MPDSKWKYGCGDSFEASIPTRYSCKLITVTCGSTDIWGGVWQCDKCRDIPVPPTPDYGDDDTGPYDGAYLPHEEY